jgi:ubiquinone/menaquinone biosynthesis C-methylase UbiE
MFNVFLLIFSSVTPYWFNPKIHNFGNTGILGNVHAASTPFITRLIDYKAYDGRDVRKEIYNTFEGNVLDLCCGTGFSTKPGHTGIDTSLEMLRLTKVFNPGSNYLCGNAESYGKDKEFDTVSCMFAFHEMPRVGHLKIIRNALRVAKKEIIIIDISTNYEPSDLMLSGEPYINDYLKNIDSIMYNYGFTKKTFIKNHIDVWNLKI